LVDEQGLFRRLAHTPLCALMRRAVSVSPETSVDELTRLILERDLECLIVVNAEEEPLGVVTAHELLRERDERADTDEEPVHLRGDLRTGFHVHTLARSVAAEVMQPIALTLRESTPVTLASARLVLERLVRAPVVTRNGKLSGLVSVLDMLRWIAVASSLRPRADA
jgi:CBS-domain-containing membrane protein